MCGWWWWWWWGSRKAMTSHKLNGGEWPTDCIGGLGTQALLLRAQRLGFLLQPIDFGLLLLVFHDEV